MKKMMSLILAFLMVFFCMSAWAEGGTPPEKPDGDSGAPGGEMGTPPDGGMPGGSSSGVDSYDAVLSLDSDTELTGEFASTGTDENAILVTGGVVTLTDATVSRISENSTGGDNASFYGVGAAILATGGNLNIENTVIDTDAAGGAGVFSYRDGVITISDSVISTHKDTSGGIHVAGGGTLMASNLTVTTQGNSSAAIRSDRGSGTMIVDGGSYTSNGEGSPAVYVTADITIRDAALNATASEALCLEGLNSVYLYDCALEGNMKDLSQNDNTWTVILYQSMSGDAAVGQGIFTMDGGQLISHNGGLFYTTNTESVFVLRNVEITASEDAEYFLRCTGNQNERGWGSSGSNGADCVFTLMDQEANGNVLWDSISTLTLYITDNSTLKGAVLDDESCAGSGGSGCCTVVLDESSSWIVTEDSTVTTLQAAGTILDADGNSVSIVGTDGTVYTEGSSVYTITVENYSDAADISEAGTISDYDSHLI